MGEFDVKKTTVCKYCGEKNLAWVRQQGLWNLAKTTVKQNGEVIMNPREIHRCHRGKETPEGITMNRIELGQAEEDSKELKEVVGEFEVVLRKLKKLLWEGA